MTRTLAPKLRAALAMAGLAAAVLLAYQPVWQAGFIWDDDAYVTHNPHLRSPAGLLAIWTDLTATPQYYPMVFTTYWFEHLAWGLDPMGYHLVNLALHAANALLLLGLLRRWGVRGAWLAAFLFALHPVAVESVAWITERKNTLSLLFALLTLHVWTRFAGLDGRPEHRDPARAVGAFLLFVAALLSKTVTCTLPAVMLVLVWWKRGRVRARDVLPLLPFFAAGIGFGLLTAWLETVHVGATGEAWALPHASRLLLAVRVAAFYAWKALAPHPLMFFYPRWEVRAADPWLWVSAAALLAALGTALAVAVKHNRRGPLAALLIYFGVLFPALGFFNVYPMRYSWVADHFQYHALPALAALAAALFSAGAARIPRQAAQATLAVTLTLFASATHFHSRAFTGAEALWLDTIAKNDRAWMAHNNLGHDYYEAGLFDEAEVHLLAALGLRSDLPEPLTNLGLIRMNQGRLDEALAFQRAAVTADPAYARAQNNLGLALIQAGELEAALDPLTRAVELDPGYNRAFGNLGNLHYLLGRHRDAAEAWRMAVRPPSPDRGAINNLAWLLATSTEPGVRNTRDAMVYARLNTELSPPGDPQALDTLAAAYAAIGNFDRAIDLAERAKQSAREAGDEASLRSIQEHLGRYRAREPVRETPANPPSR